MPHTAELKRLEEHAARARHWRRWGTYLPERQWGTVREDYSADGAAWDSFSHDHARSRAYRWGEDGLLGICDNRCRLCFAPALWNMRDGILKERLFGLTNPEGNHGEDVKEAYFYLRATPTGSYAKALYKYPQAQFPYVDLVHENAQRDAGEREFELFHTGAFDDGRYFDIEVEYAKESPESVLVRLTATNHGPRTAPIELLPQIWFRNTWSWGREPEGGAKPELGLDATAPGKLWLVHPQLGPYVLATDPADPPPLGFLFTENDSDTALLYGREMDGPAKNAFHRSIIDGDKTAPAREPRGTKAAARYRFQLDPGESRTVRLRLYAETEAPGDGEDGFGDFDRIFAARAAEAEAYYDHHVLPAGLDAEEREIAMQAYAGLVWSKQFYYYVVEEQLAGEPGAEPPLPARPGGRNADWPHVYSRDILSMPDKWEYPWFAAWDLAFQMLPMAHVDPGFAKRQISLFLREWYMHPNGQLPAYEYHFGDVNPPVHAWAALRAYQIDADKSGRRDVGFLAGAFQKLLLNFTWWVNRKDERGLGIFSGGFLGLDNISAFDRSAGAPGGGQLEQADATGWMAFYCATMLRTALELALRSGPNSTAYEDMASKFFEHFTQIIHAINTHGGTGLWDELDGFYYDQVRRKDKVEPVKVRSLVGLIPLAAVEIIDDETLERLPGFARRFRWFLENKKELAQHVRRSDYGTGSSWLLSAVPPKRLTRLLTTLFDEDEFLAPHGIRSLSKAHAERPFVYLDSKGREHKVSYTPGESKSGMFGGNSNWRGPVWFPLNLLLIEALERYADFYDGVFKIRFPTRSEDTDHIELAGAAARLRARLASIFKTPPGGGRRPFADEGNPLWSRPECADLLLFHEYFEGDTARGLGAAHQTGWTALVALCLGAG